MKKSILFFTIILGFILLTGPIASTSARSALDSAPTENYQAAVVEPFTFQNVGYTPWTAWQDVIPVHVNPSSIPVVQEGKIDWNSIVGQEQRYYIVYNNHTIGVWYNVASGRWAIFNQDREAMPVGADFNVFIPGNESHSFVHAATADNITGHSTEIDHPLANYNPGAILHVTQNWNPGGSLGVYNDHPIGVFFNFASGRWEIFNLDQAAMPVGVDFNVFIPSSEAHSFVHAATAENTNGAWTWIDYPELYCEYLAYPHVTPHWIPGGSPLGVYNDHQVGVSYEECSWTIFNQNFEAIPEGAYFNVYFPGNESYSFLHAVTNDNIAGDSTVIDHPLANNNPTATLHVTPNRKPIFFSCDGWCDEIGIDSGGDHWNDYQFSAMANDNQASFDISYATTLYNRWDRGSSNDIDDPEIPVVDLVVREGSTTFEPFDPARGMLNSVTVRSNWQITSIISMYLLDEDAFCDAEGKATGRTLITSWIGGFESADENADFEVELESTTGWQTNWGGIYSVFYDFANNTPSAPGNWYEVMWDALACVANTDECWAVPPDWGDLWHVPTTKSDEAYVVLTPEEYRSLLSPDGLFQVHTSKIDYHELWYEVEDWFDASQYASKAVGNIDVQYNYTPSIPVVTIERIVDELGHDLTVPEDPTLVNLEVEVAASFTNAGNIDPHTAFIDWGDGTVEDLGTVTYAISARHTYANPGLYEIVLTVSDEYGNTGDFLALIQVVDPIDGTGVVIDRLVPSANDPNVAAAIAKLEGQAGGEAKNGALDFLEKGNLNAALEKIKQAMQYLEAAEAADPTLDLTNPKSLLALTAKSIAVDKITQAEAAATKPKELSKIQQARDLVIQGDIRLVALDHVGAVLKYQQAVRTVQGRRRF